jgi:hypothetical protein
MLLLITVWVIWIHVLLEWLFFVTKQSFMTAAGPVDTVRALLLTPVPLIIAGAAIIALCRLISAVVRIGPVRKACFFFAMVVPAIVVAGTALLIIDNFTYTVFQYGIRMTAGALRYGYVVLILVLLVLAYRYLYEFRELLAQSAPHRILGGMTLSIFFVSIYITALIAEPSELAVLRERLVPPPLERKPNIIMISIDGMEAASMSCYGYERDTTPFLRGLAATALVCENNFPNADASAASISSIFCGKLPTETHLILPSDILQGDDSHNHLPGLLKKYGYTTVDFGVPRYVDPIEMNLLNAFDWVSGRRITKPTAAILFGSLFGDRSYFLLRKMRDRVTERLLHVFGVREMGDPLAEVVETGTKKLRDPERVAGVLAAIEESPPPVFIHAHFLGAHGPKFKPTLRHFSAGQKESKNWMTDFYDDAILQLDAHMREIVEGLEERGILQNTIFIVCTDHGQKWAGYSRTPLMFRFPNGEHRGWIKENTQNLDIAATLLDYLGIEQPQWMGGVSLLLSGGESRRPIFSVERIPGLKVTKRKKKSGNLGKAGPPFYGMRSAVIVYCNQAFELHLDRSRLLVRYVDGHTAPCPDSEIPDPATVGRWILEHLQKNNYDISSIQTPLIISDVR